MASRVSDLGRLRLDTGSAWLVAHPTATLTIVVGIISLAPYVLALGNGFVNFDDGKNFISNPHYRGLGWAQLRWMFTTTHMGQYIPLTWITLGVDYLLWGLNPAGYHLTSMLLHAATAVVLYFVSLRLIGVATGRSGDWTVMAGSALAAVLFAVHPLRVESVAWATERRDVLSGLFYLLTLLTWFRWIGRDKAARRWYWAAVALFACAILSKALTVTLVATLFVLDIYPFGRLGRGTGWWSREARGIYLEKLPFAVLAAGGSAIALLAMASIGNLTSLERLGFAERSAISAFSILFYLWKTVVPTGLSPLYQLPLTVDPLAYLWCFVAVAAIGVVAVVERRRATWFTTAWVVYLITLLPVLGLFQNGMQIAADRYTYLACIPWSIVAGGVAAALLHRAAAHGKEAQAALLVVSLAVVIALQVAAVNQIAVWRNGVTLWTQAVQVDPASAVAYNNLGAALLEANRPEEAAEILSQAVDRIEGLPSSARANVVHVLGTVRQHQGNLAHAEHLYREAISLDGYHADAWNGLGTTLAMQGKLEEALDAFRRALAILPGNLDACTNAKRAALLTGKTPPELRSCGWSPN